MSERERMRELVNDYDTRHRHLRGYYSRTDLLAIVKEAWQASAREQAKKDYEIAADDDNPHRSMAIAEAIAESFEREAGKVNDGK